MKFLVQLADLLEKIFILDPAHRIKIEDVCKYV